MFRLATASLMSFVLSDVFAPEKVLAQSADTQATTALSPAVVVFQNVRVFDGKGSTLSAPSNVLVRGNKIERISTTPIPVDRSADTRIIEGGGRTLMPGLIDAHAHVTFYTLPLAFMLSSDAGYLQIRAAVGAGSLLMHGFTSVRDVSGPTFGIKRAIDEGLLPGPRIWPSGAMISQTSGHADNRTLGDLPSTVNPAPHASVRYGYVAVADGVDAMHRTVREMLMQGASQINLAVGGGVSSNFDPIDVTEYTRAEIRRARPRARRRADARRTVRQ
jgi:imidazolonepropionase-like amidohydrolase